MRKACWELLEGRRAASIWRPSWRRHQALQHRSATLDSLPRKLDGFHVKGGEGGNVGSNSGPWRTFLSCVTHGSPS